MVKEMDGKSLDLQKENINKLKELFPEIMTDGNKIDFDKLKDLMSSDIDDDDERYNFTWNGKRNAIKSVNAPSRGTLIPNKAKSKDWDNTKNLYIEGDNLEVLKLLQKSYNSKIKMIYIDPPYNTGKDFVYKDSYKDGLQNYYKMTDQINNENVVMTTNNENNGRYHTNWLNMIYPRIVMARNLLSNDGVIFISIDGNEQANLEKVCNEIFGESNKIGDIILQTATDNNPGQLKIQHEYIKVYAKIKDKQPYWSMPNENAKKIQKYYETIKNKYNSFEEMQIDLRNWIKKHSNELEGVTHYNSIDKKGVFHGDNISNTKNGGYDYEIIHPITGKKVKKPSKGYRYPKETVMNMIKNGDIQFGKDETTIIKPKRRLMDAKDVLRSVIYEDGRSSTKDFEKLMSTDIFQNPKSVKLLTRLMGFILNDNDTVLDFFSGSGTTAEALFRLQSNRKKKESNNKFIMVQLPENLDDNLKNADKKSKNTIKNAIKFLDSINKPHSLSEIGMERIRRAGNTIKDENIDTGFKVFELSDSNIKKWNTNFQSDGQLSLIDQLNSITNNFVDGRTSEDIVYELLLKQGIELTDPIDTIQCDGSEIYSVNSGALYIVLGNKIKQDIVEKIVNNESIFEHDLSTVIIQDTGFKNDSDKLNIFEGLRSSGFNDENLFTV